MTCFKMPRLLCSAGPGPLGPRASLPGYGFRQASSTGRVLPFCSGYMLGLSTKIEAFPPPTSPLCFPSGSCFA